ncbi:acetyl-CoA C-acyltransferase [uncultured Corynebacterium sp.]|uniref:thiolase family protein n=1 Tax=uncultured Corynebacterium sp. TaxID=159447 RepID=UPI0025EAEE4B|nr:acetyl-CoA C-acyltransferase [uncultured Corynebacterium sp.]
MTLDPRAAYIVEARRTPVGRYGGALASVRPDDLAAAVIADVLEKSGVDAGTVDEVILGNANGAGEENRNVARMSWLLAGGPEHVPGMTLNRLCASGMSSVADARHKIAAGVADIVVAGGVESMTRAPWVQAKPATAWAKPGEAFDTSIGWRFTNPRHAAVDKRTLSMPETAEEVADVEGVTRGDCDAFALRSHTLALAAIGAGHFTGEITPVTVTGRRGSVTVVDTDEGPRADTSADVLAKLRPVVRPDGVVTAGNSSSLNDGASALVIASGEACEEHCLTPRARIVTDAAVGLAPAVMGMGPVPATRKALERAGWGVDDLDAVELNEAFATQSLACMRELGLDAREEIVNAWGGEIALGHPLGSSGSRIITTLLNRLESTGGRRGLATMCVGVGQGTAILIERV